ncbi:hypothetical protein EV421DRAFT_1902186 [Armillaria borealis]|uniref:Uncharacterized protein n=1 Tax=Armillaria borealis TaxID=47425 RepID=A0AA39MU24_9AGAR|nr:hypothetical protein EV421DRAFT_1902186 [Armillaria borealis]
MDDEVEDIEAFGIDWDVVDDATYMEHLQQHNQDVWDPSNPFLAAPPKTSHVSVDPPECPFNRESMDILAAALAERVDLMSRQMDVRRLALTPQSSDVAVENNASREGSWQLYCYVAAYTEVAESTADQAHVAPPPA